MGNKYHDLADFGKRLLSTPTLAQGLPLISTYAKRIIGAERCSIFIYDRDKHELWTTVADKINGKIVIDSKRGIVGRVLEIAETMIVNEPKKNPYFLGDIDPKSSFRTKHIIATPVFGSSKQVIGVLQLLNKEPHGFDHEDEKFMKFFCNFISGFIEMTPLDSDNDEYENLGSK